MDFGVLPKVDLYCPAPLHNNALGWPWTSWIFLLLSITLSGLMLYYLVELGLGGLLLLLRLPLHLLLLLHPRAPSNFDLSALFFSPNHHALDHIHLHLLLAAPHTFYILIAVRQKKKEEDREGTIASKTFTISSITIISCHLHTLNFDWRDKIHIIFIP